MGALWDFIAGKSTDWDTVEAEQAVQSSIDRKNRREERRIQENIRYYCKFCGQEFRHPRDASYHPCNIKIRYDQALANLEGGVQPSHHYCQLYEGTQKNEYRCKYCGRTAPSIRSLVLSGPCNPRHIVNIDKYNTHGSTSDTAAISLHEPAL